MSEWFEEGKDMVIQDAVEASGATEEQVRAVYASLSEAGLIDYDFEKEVFYRLVEGDEDE